LYERHLKKHHLPCRRVHDPLMDRPSRPFHPILFAAFPILFLTAHNRDVASPSAAAVPLVSSIGAIAVLQFLAVHLIGRRHKVAIVLTSTVVGFFTYGHLWHALEGRSIAGFVVGRDLVLLPVFGLFAIVVLAVVWRSERRLNAVTRALNLVALGLVLTSILSLGLDVAARPAEAGPTGEEIALRASDRDIYYLIFDRYPDAETLRAHFGFDNTPFLRSLELNGFAVVPGARANYQNTHLSLASSLNMTYLDELQPSVEPSRDLGPAFSAIARSTVARSLKRAGYRYVHVGSWWSPTSSSPVADVNLRNAPLSEFTQALYGSTALLPLLRRGYIAEADRDAVQRATTLREFASMREAIGVDGPKFVFAHFLMPHPPYVFDRNGGPVPRQERDGNVRAFLEQLRYTNRRIVRLIGDILDAPGDPVVIVQADEGPYPRLTTKIPGAWAARSDAELRVKYGILNALRLPGSRDAVSPTLSPVNAFRVVFNTYFGTRLTLLPDESYASRGPRDVYDFIPLGDRVRGRPLGHDG
jgi:hypothetical protein